MIIKTNIWTTTNKLCSSFNDFILIPEFCLWWSEPASSSFHCKNKTRIYFSETFRGFVFALHENHLINESPHVAAEGAAAQ